MVGQALVDRLKQLGHRVVIFSRSPSGAQKRFDYATRTVDPEDLRSCSILINLAGANVGAHRWTARYKKEIYESRVQLTGFLAEILQTHQIRPKLYVGASATGFYPEGSETLQEESGASGNDFLAGVCRDWEASHQKVAALAERNIIFRIGVVMSLRGGFIPRLMPIIKFGLAAPLGNGQQVMPWIAIDDLIEMFVFSIQNDSLRGVFNAVAPEILSNRDAMDILSQKMNKKCWLPPVPAWVIKLIFGEFSVELLGSRKVVPRRMIDAGFQWSHPRFSDVNLV